MLRLWQQLVTLEEALWKLAVEYTNGKRESLQTGCNEDRCCKIVSSNVDSSIQKVLNQYR